MNLVNLRDFLGVATKLKESIFKNTTSSPAHLFAIRGKQKAVLKIALGTRLSRTTTKSNPLLHPEYGFCQQNEPEHGQLQDWYPDEEIMVIPIYLNGRC